MEDVLIKMFAAIGFIVTFVGVILGLVRLHSFFEDEFPELKEKQKDIYQEIHLLYQEIHLLQQRVRELEEKVND